MACNCEEYSCLEVIASDCDGITVNLPVDEAGTWTMHYEFNGVWFKETFEVAGGADVVLPPIFNEVYAHLIKFYKPDGTFLENTCYTLDMSAVPSYSPSQYSPVMPSYFEYIVVSGTPESGLVNGRKEIAEGNSITDSRLAGYIVTGVGALSQFYNSGDYTKAKGSSTLTMTNGVSFGDDTVIIIYVA